MVDAFWSLHVCSLGVENETTRNRFLSVSEDMLNRRSTLSLVCVSVGENLIGKKCISRRPGQPKLKDYKTLIIIKEFDLHISPIILMVVLRAIHRLLQ